MTRDEAIAEIQEGLGFRSDKADVIAKRLDEAQRELEMGMSLPHFIINEDDPVVLTQGVSQYALTDAFIREVDDFGSTWPAQSISGDVYHVRKMQYDRAIATYGETLSEGPPVVYAIRSNSLKIFPTPDDTYDYRWSFYQRQITLVGGDVTDEQNAWLKHRPHLLIAMAGKKSAKLFRDMDAVKLFGEAEIKWTNHHIAEMTAKEEANIRVVRGADV